MRGVDLGDYGTPVKDDLDVVGQRFAVQRLG
jgi:hypothetical protein